MFEDAEAGPAVEGEAGGVVGDAEGGHGVGGGVGEVVDAAVGPAAALPGAVLPVGGGRVAGADGERGGVEDLDAEFEGFAGRVGEVDDGALGVAGAGSVADFGLRPAELHVVAAAVLGEDLDGLVQGAVPVGVLLGDDHDEAVLEADRDPEPVEALGPVLLGGPAAVLAGYGAHAPAAVAGAGPLGGGEGVLLALGADGAGDVPGLDEAAAFEHEAVAAPLDVVGFPDGGELGGPGDVVREPAGVGGVGVALEGDPLQGFVDDDPQRADGEVHAVVGEGVGGADGEEFVAGAQGGVGVDDPGVRVHAETEDEDGPAGVVEDVEDAAVVGVPVAADEVLHRQRGLVDGVFVEGYGSVRGHGKPPGRGGGAGCGAAGRGVGSSGYDGTSETAPGARLLSLPDSPARLATSGAGAAGTPRTDTRSAVTITRWSAGALALHDHARNPWGKNGTAAADDAAARLRRIGSAPRRIGSAAASGPPDLPCAAGPLGRRGTYPAGQPRSGVVPGRHLPDLAGRPALRKLNRRAVQQVRRVSCRGGPLRHGASGARRDLSRAR